MTEEELYYKINELILFDDDNKEKVIDLIKQYGRESWKEGYDEGIATANLDWP